MEVALLLLRFATKRRSRNDVVACAVVGAVLISVRGRRKRLSRREAARSVVNRVVDLREADEVVSEEPPPANDDDDDVPSIELVRGEDGTITPRDEAAVLRWLGLTHLAHLLDGAESEAWRLKLVRRLQWARVREGETLAKSLDQLDRLIIVVEGEIGIYEEEAAPSSSAPTNDDEEAPPMARNDSSTHSGLSGFYIDTDNESALTSEEDTEEQSSERRRFRASLGPREAVGKFSVVVAAADGVREQDETGERRCVVAKRRSVVVSLNAADLRDLCFEEPRALLFYARRCVARLHRVALFANSELLGGSTSKMSDAVCDATPLPADGLCLNTAGVDLCAGTLVSQHGDRCCLLLEGEVRCQSRLTQAPAVLFGQAWLDFENNDATDSFVTTGGGARVRWLAEDEQDIAGVVFAICLAMAPEIRTFTASGMSRRLLHAGAILMHAGDTMPAHFYVVISGRVRCGEPVSAQEYTRPSNSRSWKRHREVSRGGTVGMRGALCCSGQNNLIRTNAVCVRDTELVAVPKAVLLDANIQEQGNGGLWLRQLLASLSSEEEEDEDHEEVSTIAVFGLDDAGVRAALTLAPRLAKALEDAIDEGPVCIVRKADVFTDDNLERAYRRRQIVQHLVDKEATHRFTILLCQGEEHDNDDDWSRIVLSQADAVIVVAHATLSTSVEPSALERELWVSSENDDHRRKMIVLAHDAEEAEGPLRGSAKWLKSRPSLWLPRGKQQPRLAHFLLPVEEPDARRLARLIAGRALGVVLGGGGSRGLAHLGVLESLEANGLEIDVVGGCSQGAYMGCAYSATSQSERRLEGVRRATTSFTKSMTSPLAFLSDLTLPILSLFHGSGFTAAVRAGLLRAFFNEEEAEEEMGTIEDLWLPYFCVSTNLSTQSVAVHSEGPTTRWVRASMSVAELLPPIRDPVTNMLHADGCYVNNLPVDIMRRDFGARTVIGVSVVDTSGTEFDEVVEFGEDGVSGLRLLLRQLANTIYFWGKPGRLVPTMAAVRGILQILRNRTFIREAKKDGSIDLFLEIEPVTSYSAGAYWRTLDRVAKLANDFADPRIKLWVEKEQAKKQEKKSSSHGTLTSSLSMILHHHRKSSTISDSSSSSAPRRQAHASSSTLSSSSEMQIIPRGNGTNRRASFFDGV